MRILMLNNEYPPLGGGTGTVNQAIVHRLGSLPGIEIDLITSATGKSKEQEHLPERVRLFRVPVSNRNLHHSTNSELLTYAAKALPLARRLHHCRPYDLCFAWSAVPAGGVAWMLKRLNGLRYIVRVCGPDIPGFEQRYSSLYPILSPAIKSVWRNAEIVVAKCEDEAQMIRRVDPSAAISIVRNGVDLGSFTQAGIASDGPLRLLCVGRLIERKGQRHLIQAVRRLLDQGINVWLDLVGTGDALEGYKRLVDELVLGQHVRFLGYVPREEMAAQYAAAHVFVLPSYNEGMSVAMLEAMAAGLPLVVTRTGGTDELVIEGENGYTFRREDVETLTSHLRRLASDRLLVRELGTASRRLAAEFTWEKSADSYLRLIARIIAPAAAYTGHCDPECAIAHSAYERNSEVD